MPRTARLARLASNVDAPTPVVDGGHARPSGEVADLVAELGRILGVVEDLDSAGLPGQLGLLRRRGRRDHAGADAGGPLGQDQAHATGAGVHEHGVARLYGIGGLDQIVRGHAFQQRRRDGVRSDAVGHIRHEIGWGDAEVGVGAGRIGGHHAVTDGQRGHVVAHCGDGAAHFGADDERHVARIQPGSEVGVDEVDADRLGLDQYLAGAWGRLGPLDVAQDFGSAGLGNFDGIHAIHHPHLSSRR
ncbi:hypothetical protein ATO49_13645 [Mycolicibacterium fortuitum subsp. fortuitum DSM 46621 = ATCC 6841 = JCM 6387]|nr:hypothetical protein ATO49_13645 [Mycolicibacterium fortuitum subsp. fortuitum DSM 46621 = ATCC 6841 = JCM 6387]